MTIKNEEIIVSVCIQTYQHEKFIRQCIESVIFQKTKFPIEIIIGEDDSTDGTREICKQIAEKYPDKIRLFLRLEKDKIYIDGEKTGRYNFLSNIKEARGKYIALLDGDDFWTDELKLQKQVDWMEKNPGAMISTHPLYWKKKNTELFIPTHVDVAETNTIFTLDFLLENYFLWMSAMMFRRECINDLPSWFRDLYFIDYPLALHIAQKGDIGFIKEAMGIYNVHETGRWSSMNQLRSEIKLWRLYTVLSMNFSVKVKKAMQKWRFDRGGWLVHFYRTHLWYRSGWLKRDLERFQFSEDKPLMEKLKAPITWNDVKSNILNLLNLKINS